MSDPSSPEKQISVLHKSLKIFGFVVLCLIAVTIVYVTWVAILNWSHIGV